ncbi:MAG: transcriptional repressor LexA [Syntrophomonadaceae bacterium]|jgi:repressor LexA|nr:transcriptional repressor LexA [Syntrophomonadaceae bacterium]
MNSKTALTARQQEIFDYLQTHIKKHGYPPSVREIGQALGLSSSSTVHAHLTQLEDKGWIRRDPTKPRAIEILADDNEEKLEPEVITLPIVGKVAAGVPITAIENIDGYVSVSADFLGKGNHFLLRVSGDSMIEAGILDGDLVIVRAQEVAENGDIVVALLDDEATVKRFYRRTDHVELLPENPSMEPIIVENVVISGIVKGLIRRM